MNFIRYALFPAVLLALSGCTAVKLGIPEEFSSQATELHVKGLNGFTIGQTLKFGEYGTSRIRHGWVLVRDQKDRVSELTTEDRILRLFKIDQSTRTTSADTKYQYSMYGNGMESKIYCLERKSSEEQDIRTPVRALGEVTATRNFQYSFSAAILPLVQDFDDPWQVVIYENYDAKKDTARRLFDLPFVEEQGYATNGKDTITIRTVRTKKVTTRKGRSVNMPVKMAAGFEFRIDDGVIGILDTYQNNVWIYNELDKETKFILASISSAMLLRKLNKEDEL